MAMPTLFFATAICGAAYFLLSHRRVDLFSLAFASSCVYFLPGFFGAVPYGDGGDSTVPLESETYLVMSAVLAAIGVGAWMFEPHGGHATSRARSIADPVASQVALIVAMIGLVLTFRSDEGDLFSADKVEVMSAVSRWFYMYAVSVSLAVVLSYLHRQWWTLLLSAVLLLFSVYLGFRSHFAMTVIAVFLVHFQAQGAQRFLARNQVATLLALTAAMFFFSYKFVYRMVKLGEFDIVAERLVDPQFHLQAIVDSEPFTTQMILNEVLRSQFETDGAYIVEGLAAQSILFSERFGLEAVAFNDLFQPVLFPDIDWGMASNIWAQMLAAGGWPLFLGFLGLFVLTLRTGSRWLETSRLTTRALIALGGSYWAFYIHRNDVGFQVILEKRVLLSWLIIVLACEVVHRLGFRTAAVPAHAPAAVRSPHISSVPRVHRRPA
jgi:hypothetical protein